MNSLRVDIVYPSGYSPSIASCGIINMYPILDNTYPIKIAVKVAGTHTNNCRTQELTLTHYVFNTAEKAQAFCDKALTCFRTDDTERYQTLLSEMLESGDMQSIGSFVYL